MIDTEIAQVTMDTGVTVGIPDQRLLALSKKGLAAAFLATVCRLQNACNADTTTNLNVFGEYHSLIWIKERLAQMRESLSVELNELDGHRPETNQEFLSYVIAQLENEC